MTHIKLDGPISTLVLLGLTLPEVSERDLAKIQAAAPPGAGMENSAQRRHGSEDGSFLALGLGE